MKRFPELRGNRVDNPNSWNETIFITFYIIKNNYIISL
jgi:hypothetical protein